MKMYVLLNMTEGHSCPEEEGELDIKMSLLPGAVEVLYCSDKLETVIQAMVDSICSELNKQEAAPYPVGKALREAMKWLPTDETVENGKMRLILGASKTGKSLKLNYNNLSAYITQKGKQTAAWLIRELPEPCLASEAIAEVSHDNKADISTVEVM